MVWDGPFSVPNLDDDVPFSVPNLDDDVPFSVPNLDGDGPYVFTDADCVVGREREDGCGGGSKRPVGSKLGRLSKLGSK